MAEQELPEIKLDADNLYRDEQISDLRAGAIRRLIPVTETGEDDSSRPVIYEGSTTLMTPAGSLPINFRLEVDNLKDAIDQFPEAAKKGIEETLEELQRLRREHQSSIVVPGQGGAGGPGGGMGGPQGPGMGGPGGGIKMP